MPVSMENDELGELEHLKQELLLTQALVEQLQTVVLTGPVGERIRTVHSQMRGAEKNIQKATTRMDKLKEQLDLLRQAPRRPCSLPAPAVSFASAELKLSSKSRSALW